HAGGGPRDFGCRVARGRVRGARGHLVTQSVAALITGTGGRLVAGDPELLDTVGAVQGTDRHDHRQSRAVGVGDDATRAVAHLVRVDLGDNQWNVRVQPEGTGVVDRDSATRRGDRR